MGLGQSLSGCHRPADAATILGRLLDDTDVPPAIRVQALRLLARVEHARDDRSASRRHFAEAAEAAELVSTELTVDVLVEWAYSESPTSPGRAMPIAARARSRARSCDRVVAWWAEIVWASSVLMTGDPAGLAELADPDALPELLAGPTGDAHWSAEAATVTVALLTERYDADEVRFGRTLSAAEAAGAAEAAASFALLHAYGLTRSGRLSQALDALDRARAWVDVVAAREGLVYAGYAYVLLLMGRLDESQDHLDRACRLAVAHADPQTMMTTREVAGHRALREGELTVAHQRYLELEEISTSIGIGDPCMGAWAGHAVHAHLATGHRQDADRVIAWLRTRALCTRAGGRGSRSRPLWPCAPTPTGTPRRPRSITWPRWPTITTRRFRWRRCKHCSPTRDRCDATGTRCERGRCCGRRSVSARNAVRIGWSGTHGPNWASPAAGSVPHVTPVSSPPPNAGSPTWPAPACRTGRSPPTWASPRPPWKPTSGTSTRKKESPPADSSPLPPPAVSAVAADANKSWVFQEDKPPAAPACSALASE